MEHVFKFNIWDYFNIEAINNELDESLENNKIIGYAADIGYECIGVEKDGTISIKAEFELLDEDGL